MTSHSLIQKLPLHRRTVYCIDHNDSLYLTSYLHLILTSNLTFARFTHVFTCTITTFSTMPFRLEIQETIYSIISFITLCFTQLKIHEPFIVQYICKESNFFPYLSLFQTSPVKYYQLSPTAGYYFNQSN